MDLVAQRDLVVLADLRGLEGRVARAILVAAAGPIVVAAGGNPTRSVQFRPQSDSGQRFRTLIPPSA
jgi:hypothetical protein